MEKKNRQIVINVSYILAALVAVGLFVVMFVRAYRSWSQWGEYSGIDVLFSLCVHGGIAVAAWAGMRWCIKRWIDRD